MSIRPIDHILDDLNQLSDEIKAIWQPNTILRSEDLHTLVDGYLDVLTDVAESTDNGVDEIIESAGWNGIKVSRLKSGNTFSYWMTGSATATQNIPASGKLYLATPADFPNLVYYQGAPIYFDSRVISPAGSMFSADCVIGVDSTGIYFIGQGTAQQISAGNRMTFNMVLLLDPQYSE